jgi:hypothetical protein
MINNGPIHNATADEVEETPSSQDTVIVTEQVPKPKAIPFVSRNTRSPGSTSSLHIIDS